MRAVLNDEPALPSNLNGKLPRDLETICLKCLNKEAGRHYGNAEALADDLRRWQRGEPIAARPAGKIERIVKWVKRRPAAAAALALVGVLIAVVFVAFGLVAAQLQKTETALAAQELEQKQREKAEQEVSRQLRETKAALDERDRVQKERTQAMVFALRQAAPGAVINILLLFRDVYGMDAVLPTLREQWAAKDAKPQMRMRVGLVLLGRKDANVSDDLADWLLKVSDPAEMLVVRDWLGWHAATELRDRFWKVAEDAAALPEERFRALVALAAFDPRNKQWAKHAPAVVERMLAANPLHLGIWVEALRPVGKSLLSPLSEVYRNAKSPERREFAATVLADYAAERPDTLADLLLDADPKQYEILFPVLLRDREQAVDSMRRSLKVSARDEASQPERERLARRQATGAATLLKMNAPADAWPLFRHRPDPEARSQLIWRSGLLGVDPKLIVQRLDEEKNVSARRAMILALGEYNGEQLPPDVRGPLTDKLLDWYRNDPDPGIHGAIDWLLRHGKEGLEARPLDWGQAAKLKKIDGEMKRRDPDEMRRWYVNGQGQTMVIVPGPVEFRMGSPLTEKEREAMTRRHIFASQKLCDCQPGGDGGGFSGIYERTPGRTEADDESIQSR